MGRVTGFSTIGRLITAESKPNSTESHPTHGLVRLQLAQLICAPVLKQIDLKIAGPHEGRVLVIYG